MNNIQTFNHSEFGTLNALIIDGEPWFIGKDIAILLGYQTPQDALKKHVDESDKRVFLKSRFATLENIPNRGLTCINESGLYSLILSSKLPQAKRFKHWVTSEVLPTIRKHGVYMTKDRLIETLSNPESLVQILTVLQKEQKLNRELTAVNNVYTEKLNTYSPRQIIVALVRTYASRRCDGNFVKAWNVYYKQLNYKLKINLRERKTKGGMIGAKLLDFLKVRELKEAAKIAVAMCEEANINTGEVINKTSLATIDCF